MRKTIFTKIIEGSVKAPIISESKKTITILDKNPLTKGHSLVITKVQINHLDDCDNETYQEIFRQVHKLSEVIRKNLKPKRVAVVVHGFEIPHAHVHVVPLYTGKEIRLTAKVRKKLDVVSEEVLLKTLVL